MQVVYSGGSTPTPSPRVQRKLNQGYSRPIFTGKTSRLVTSQSTSKDRGEVAPEPESSLRDSIPAMRKAVAVTCLILNILLPGLGTFVAGLTTLCGSAIRKKTMTSQKVVCSNTWVAFLQFVTAFIFLLGWIWSIVWGVAFITISDDYYKNFKRPSMPKKPNIKDSFNLEPLNGTRSDMNRAGSSHGLSTHLQKTHIARSSSADQAPQPCIVHQTASGNSHSETSLVSKRATHDKKTKHNKYFKSQKSEEDAAASAPLNMEQIMIHSLPKAPTKAKRGVLRREDTITSTTSSVSISEDPAHSFS
ncbi:uncharacterized protein LOC128209121 [Mya arenaria]|uniref:uncharacterized protein LOC128209121 n=1 Tax=Mya arenaria TaxID=6604 RepID=UPI0022E4FB65|nr:uncharacterized protein LOC128209121 [Mya arenaria]